MKTKTRERKKAICKECFSVDTEKAQCALTDKSPKYLHRLNYPKIVN